MWPYPWTHVGTPSHLGHMDRVAATMPSQAHAGAAQEAPDIGQWKGQDVPMVRPSSCNVKGGIPSSRRYIPYPYLPESLCLYLLCPSAALLCYTGFQNHSLIRSTSCSCSTCCFGLGFELRNLQDFIKKSRALIKDIFLVAEGSP